MRFFDGDEVASSEVSGSESVTFFGRPRLFGGSVSETMGDEIDSAFSRIESDFGLRLRVFFNGGRSSEVDGIEEPWWRSVDSTRLGLKFCDKQRPSGK